MTVSADISRPTPSMVTRMTAILDTFDSLDCCRSLQDVASLTRLPRSTAYRILDQLVRLGWVQHSIDGYRLGWRANRLPSRANEESRLREVAAPHLHALAVQTRLIVHLGVLDGPLVRYLDKIGGGVSVPSRVGGSLPAHLTAVGKAMLAHVDPESLDAVLDQAQVCVDSAAVHRDLASVRMRGGLSTDYNGPLAAVACIGAPIFDRKHQVAGGLSVCDGGSSAPLDRYTPILLELAKRISVQLGQVQQTTGPLQGSTEELTVDRGPRVPEHGDDLALVGSPVQAVQNFSAAAASPQSRGRQDRIRQDRCHVVTRSWW